MYLLAQLSDPHLVPPGSRLFDRLDTAAMLRAALTSVRLLRPRPHALLLTGDLAADGEPAAYAVLAELLRVWDGPVYLLPGNHDDRAALRAAFPTQPWLGTGGPIHYVIDLDAYALIVLDTLVPGAEHGELDDAQLEWLADALATRRRQRIVIAMHHPPFATGMPKLDAIGLRRGGETLARLAMAHGGVAHIACGHVHRAVHTLWAGVPASTAPSTAHQIAADWSGEQPLAWTLEPPGYRVLVLASEGVAAHTLPAAQYAGPYPYGD
ncbi:MAG: phosphodiesterase [Pigmentiphaga sp.]